VPAARSMSVCACSGLGAGGAVAGGDLITLRGAALCCGDFPGRASQELPLPPLNAVVTDFPQEHLDPAHAVEGMLGARDCPARPRKFCPA
jgi:hypothetical protein